MTHNKMCVKLTAGAKNIFYRVESSSAGPFTYELTYEDDVHELPYSNEIDSQNLKDPDPKISGSKHSFNVYCFFSRALAVDTLVERVVDNKQSLTACKDGDPSLILTVVHEVDKNFYVYRMSAPLLHN